MTSISESSLLMASAVLSAENPRRIKEGSISSKSGTFAASRGEPIHRWFKYSAGFSSVWTESLIREKSPRLVLDPFVGSGTVCVVADTLGVASVGVEAHPFVFRMARAKLSWSTDIEQFRSATSDIAKLAKASRKKHKNTSDLLEKCYKESVLDELFALRSAYRAIEDSLPSAIRDLVFLAISAILRPVSHVGTAQWQYILPSKTKAKPANVFDAFEAQVSAMCADMTSAQLRSTKARSKIIASDARTLVGVGKNTVDLVITSPPYANNYDYADATRLEMTFWGEIDSWGDLHDAVRKYLVRETLILLRCRSMNLSDGV